LPPVLPIVLYNGRPKWTAKTEVADLIVPPADAAGRMQQNRVLRQCGFTLDQIKVLFGNGEP